MQEYKRRGKQPTPRQDFIREIADAALVSETTVEQWMTPKGAKPGAKSLRLLAIHFGCEVEDLGFSDRG